MKIVDNYEAKIWLGLREGYTDNLFTTKEVCEEIRNYCTEVGQCVTISPTHFAYVHGEEPGVVIGFINYPRYPYSEAEIRNRARNLAERLMKKFKQYRVTITFYPAIPAGSVMLENEEFKEQ
jgi:ferredoxin